MEQEEDIVEKLDTSEVIKIGIVCRDIEDTARRYGELFDVEVPPVRYPDPNRKKPEGAYMCYQGINRQIRLKATHVNLTPIYLELIEPADDTPSPWLDHLNKFGTSICFLSFYIHGFRKDIDFMEAHGYQKIFEEEKGPERYAYFDTLETLGVMLELKERDA